MPIRTFLDLPRNEAGLVERFIGSAYDTVKVVSDNLEAVLAVPTDLETLQGLEANVNNSFDIAKAFIAEQVAAASSSAADAAQSDANGKGSAAIALDQAEQAKNSASAALSSSQSAQSSLDQATTQANNSASSASASAESANEAKQYRDELSGDVTDIKGRYQSILDATNNSAESAKQASVSEQNASVSAQEALSSKQVAETLIKTASGVAQTYPDTATALSNTADGQYFNIAGSGDVYSYSYINKGGNAVLQSAMPSYAYAQTLDANKVSRSGDTVTGDFNVTGNTSLNLLKVSYISEIISPNKQVVLDVHADDDGAYRQYLSKEAGKNFKVITQVDSNYNLYSDSGYAYINGNKLVDFAHMGAGSGVNADTFRGTLPTDYTTSARGDDLQKQINGRVLNQSIDDGNNSSIGLMSFNKSGHLHYWSKAGDFDVANLSELSNYLPLTGGNLKGDLFVQGIMGVRSPNNQNGLDLHSDDDGIVRLYAKNGNVNWQQFLGFNPQGNLDLLSPTGAVYINGSRIFAQNFMGSGSGLDADTVDGTHGSDLATKSSVDALNSSLQDKVSQRVLGNYKMSPGGLTGYSAYLLGDELQFCFKDGTGADKWMHFKTSENTQTELDNKFDKAGGDISGSVKAAELHTGSVQAYSDRLDINYASRKASFQTDGNMVFYGTDGSNKTSIMDGNITTSGALDAGDKLSVAGSIESKSKNGLNVINYHSDNDGIIRGFTKTENTNWQQFLDLNPINGKFTVYTPTGEFNVNGNRVFSTSFMGSGSGLDADTVDGKHASDLADKVSVEASLDTKFDKTGGTIQGTVNADVLNTGALSAYKNGVYINYGSRKTSFQDDGSLVNYGTDGATLTTLKDGVFWTKDSISSDHNINATGILHLQSYNGLNGFDMHSDDDGLARMYAKNGAVNWQQLLLYNPQGDLELAASGILKYNGNTVAHSGNMGAGSGFNADLLRGQDPVTLCGSGDVQNGESGWTRLPNNRIDMWFAGDWVPGNSGVKELTFNFPKPISQTDIVTVSTQLKSADLATAAASYNKTQVSYKLTSWTNTSVNVFKQVFGSDLLYSRPVFVVKGIV